MPLTYDYNATTRRAESVLTDALDNWKNGLNAFTAPLQALPSAGSLPNFPQFDAAEAVELQFNFVKRVTDVNYGYARQLAEATNTVTDAVRQHLEGLNTAVLEQMQSVSQATQSVVDTLEDSVRENADEAERVQRETRQEAEKAERNERRNARNAAREHYRSLTKSELSDEAAKRNLRKTGSIDELVERLVEDDTNK
jgi:hypothetical protein